MDKSSWIQFGLLLIALVALIFQDRHLFLDQQKREKRIEAKLPIFSSPSGKNHTEAEVINAYKQQEPLRYVGESEIRKALYEMLADETIYYQEDKTCRAHWRHLKS